MDSQGNGALRADASDIHNGAPVTHRHAARIQAAAIAEYVEAMRRMEIAPRALHTWYKKDCPWSDVSVSKPTKHALLGWVAVDPLLPRDVEHLVTGGYKRLAVSRDGQLYYLFDDANTRHSSPALISLPYQVPSFDRFPAPSLPELLGRGLPGRSTRAHRRLLGPAGQD